ncbi:hypothetical protein EDM80_14545, partial [bacterium]
MGKPLRSSFGVVVLWLEDASGKAISLPSADDAFFMISEGVEKTLRTLPPGQYTLVLVYRDADGREVPLEASLFDT